MITSRTNVATFVNVIILASSKLVGFFFFLTHLSMKYWGRHKNTIKILYIYIIDVKGRFAPTPLFCIQTYVFHIIVFEFDWNIIMI